MRLASPPSPHRAGATPYYASFSQCIYISNPLTGAWQARVVLEARCIYQTTPIDITASIASISRHPIERISAAVITSRISHLISGHAISSRHTIPRRAPVRTPPFYLPSVLSLQKDERGNLTRAARSRIYHDLFGYNKSALPALQTTAAHSSGMPTSCCGSVDSSRLALPGGHPGLYTTASLDAEQLSYK